MNVTGEVLALTPNHTQKAEEKWVSFAKGISLFLVDGLIK